MPREFKVKFILDIGIAFAVLAVIGVLMFYLQGDISSESDAVAKINQNIADKDYDLKDLSDLGQEQSVATPLFAKMNAAMLGEDTLFSLQQDFKTIAQSNNLALSSEFGAETSATANTPGEVAIEMTLQGSYNGILAFLQNIESGVGFISISSVDLIEQSTGGNFSAIINGDIPFHE